MIPKLSELEEPIWAISWSGGTWPHRKGVTYYVAETAIQTAQHKHPDRVFTIVTFEAAQRQQHYEQNGTTV